MRRLLIVGGSLAVTLVVTCISFFPILRNQFVNWDDPDTIVHNAHLLEPGISGWAFTTTHMSHYQPVSWLAWSGVARVLGIHPGALHALSLAGHLLNAALVFLLTARLARAAGVQTPGAAAGISATAAVLFAIHPLRVETVAWASAFPYVLALSFLLLSTLAYTEWAVLDVAQGLGPGKSKKSDRALWPWLAASIACYALSLLCRPVALPFPLVLIALDVYPLGLFSTTKHASSDHRDFRRRLFLTKLPYFVLAGAALVVESGARPLESIGEYGVGARLTATAMAPLLYLGRTIWPVGLTPLDPLPLDPQLHLVRLVLGAVGLAAVTVLAGRLAKTAPALCVGWICYLLLLAPAVGLTPSGLQATADRYTYVPSVALAIAAGAATISLWRSRGGRVVGVVGLAALTLALGLTTRIQVRWWHDSVSLWTRAVDLDPTNDVALYNLGAALAEAGDEAGAIARYRQTLRLIPDHGPARHNLELLEAARYERKGNEMASGGQFAGAIDAYRAALERDPKRRAAQVSLGMAELQLRQIDAASRDLDAAWRAGARDPAIANALAFLWIQSGREREARQILEEAFIEQPGDLNTRHNLARLLATARDPSLRNGTRAVDLALSVMQATGARDARALDTLAAAYAETGQWPLARETAARAENAALTAGDKEMAVEIRTRGRLYSARGPR